MIKGPICWRCRRNAPQVPGRLRRAARRQAFLLLRIGGLTYAEIGSQVGVTRQYVQEVCRPNRETIAFVEARAKGRCEDCQAALRHGHVHHIRVAGCDPETYQRADNLAHLCRSCHQKMHPRHQ